VPSAIDMTGSELCECSDTVDHGLCEIFSS